MDKQTLLSCYHTECNSAFDYANRILGENDESTTFQDLVHTFVAVKTSFDLLTILNKVDLPDAIIPTSIRQQLQEELQSLHKAAIPYLDTMNEMPFEIYDRVTDLYSMVWVRSAAFAMISMESITSKRVQRIAMELSDEAMLLATDANIKFGKVHSPSKIGTVADTMRRLVAYNMPDIL